MNKPGKAPNDAVAGVARATRYRAPALEKGLDIVELLANEPRPLSASIISQRLGRSTSELFRMIQVLEKRGYIEQSENGDGYKASDRLFILGMDRAPLKTMLEIALPRMRGLSTVIGQSCHLAVRSGGQMVVVARIESPGQIGFSVRIGYRQSLAVTASGTVLFAFQDDADRARWLETLGPEITDEQADALCTRAEQVRARGYERVKSSFSAGVTDISAPVLRGLSAAAALTVPFLHSTPLMMPIDETVKHLRATTAQVSAALLVEDHRV